LLKNIQHGTKLKTQSLQKARGSIRALSVMV
jgi:hypothetical protein